MNSNIDLLLDYEKCSDPAAVGFKFSRQAQLKRAGFNIPDFYCLPVTVYDSIANQMREKYHDSDDPANSWGEIVSWSEKKKSHLRSMQISKGLRNAIFEAFDNVSNGVELVAVRACVIADSTGLGEDSAADPFAGLSNSFLYVTRDRLLSAVVDCWASAFNPQLLLYRGKRGLPPSGARVVVGIQRMINGTRSFVAFTQDPLTAERRTIIASAYGIGEGVVQESADIDHFYVNADRNIVESDVVFKKRLVLRDIHSGTTIAQEGVPPSQANEPVLDNATALSIADLGYRVEEFFGTPQDIEGTITNDGQIHLVQARPVVLAPEHHRSNVESNLADVDSQRKSLWTNSNITESFPGVASALTFSTAVNYYAAFLADGYRRWGVPICVLEREENNLRNLIGQFDGRIYCRINIWYKLHGNVPIFWIMRSTWEKSFFGIEPDLVVTGPRENGRTFAGKIIFNIKSRIEIISRLLVHPIKINRFFNTWNSFVEQHRDLNGATSDEILAVHRKMWRLFSRSWGTTLVNGFLLVWITGIVREALGRITATDTADLINGLLCGGKENRSVAGLRSLLALAEGVRENPAASSAMNSRPDEAVWMELSTGAYGAELADAANAHLRKYGDRSLHDLMLESATPRQQPWLLIGLLRPFVSSHLTVANSRATERQARQAAEEQLRLLCGSPSKRIIIKVLLALMRWLTRIREDTRFSRSELYGISRDIFIKLGEKLAEGGLLERKEDVFDLSVEEVIDAFSVGGTVPGKMLRELAKERAAIRAEQKALPDPPPTIRTIDGELRSSLIIEKEKLGEEKEYNPLARLKGIPSSSGTVRGIARVILDPKSISPESVKGQILIARETDPGWLVLMLSAKGLVAERGTLLSHTAITGRVLGIPTVVSVLAATKVIPDGALIELDGGAGIVRVLSPEVGSDDL